MVVEMSFVSSANVKKIPLTFVKFGSHKLADGHNFTSFVFLNERLLDKKSIPVMKHDNAVSDGTKTEPSVRRGSFR